MSWVWKYRDLDIVPNNWSAMVGQTSKNPLFLVPWFAFRYCAVLWYAFLWCALLWYAFLWYAFLWYDLIWYDMMWLWYDMIWYDMIWYDMICYDMLRSTVVYHAALVDAMVCRKGMMCIHSTGHSEGHTHKPMLSFFLFRVYHQTRLSKNSSQGLKSKPARKWVLSPCCLGLERKGVMFRI